MKRAGNVRAGVEIAAVIAAGAAGVWMAVQPARNPDNPAREAQAAHSAVNADVAEVLSHVATRINSSLPRMVDSETRLENTHPGNRNFRYTYTFVHFAAKDIDASQVQRALQRRLLNSFCNSRDMRRAFVDNGVQVTHAYFGNDGKPVLEIVLMPSQCGELD